MKQEEEEKESRVPENKDIFEEAAFAKSLVWQMEKQLKNMGITQGEAKKTHNITVSYKRKMVKSLTKFENTLKSMPYGSFSLKDVDAENKVLISEVLFYAFCIEKLFFRFQAELLDELNKLHKV